MDRQVVRAFNYGVQQQRKWAAFNNNTMSTNHNHLTSIAIIIKINNTMELSYSNCNYFIAHI